MTTPWDEFKREQEENEGTVAFQEFPVWRYEFLEGPRKGEPAFDLYRLPSGLWKFEPFDSDIREEAFEDIDDLIDFMRKLNIRPPSSPTAESPA